MSEISRATQPNLAFNPPPEKRKVDKPKIGKRKTVNALARKLKMSPGTVSAGLKRKAVPFTKLGREKLIDAEIYEAVVKAPVDWFPRGSYGNKKSKKKVIPQIVGKAITVADKTPPQQIPKEILNAFMAEISAEIYRDRRRVGRSVTESMASLMVELRAMYSYIETENK